MPIKIVPLKRETPATSLGVTIRNVGGKHMIQQVAPGSPAKFADCPVGSHIVGVDGVDMSNASHEELCAAFGGKTTIILKIANAPVSPGRPSRSSSAPPPKAAAPSAPSTPAALTSPVQRQAASAMMSTGSPGMAGFFSPVRRVRIQKPANSSFGFTILDSSHAAEKGGLQEVASVGETSPAKEAGVKQNDVILSINGASLAGKSHTEVLATLKAAGNDVELELQQTVDDGGDDVVDPSELPIRIRYGTVNRTGHSSLGVRLEEDENYAGLRIEALVPGLPFANAGVFSVGDVLIVLDGHFVLDDYETTDEIIPLLMNAGESFEVGVATEEEVNSIREPLTVETPASSPAKAAAPSGEPWRVVLKKRPGVGVGLKLQDGNPGALVGGFNDGTPAADAAKAGEISTGDRIVAVNGTPSATLDLSEVCRLFSSGTGGGKVTAGEELVLMLAKPGGAGPQPPRTPAAATAATSSVRTVTLDRTAGRLGISLAESPHDFPKVMGLSAQGVAAKSGLVSEGMVIVSANGRSLKGTSLAEFLSTSPSKKVTLVLKEESDTTPVPVLVPLSVTKAPNEKLGVQLTQTDDLHGIECYLHAIVPSHPLGRAGAVDGDVVVSVNGFDVGGAGLEAVTAKLAKSGSAFEMVVRRSDAPEGRPF